MEVCGQLHPKGRSPWYPLDRRVGGPQSRSGLGGEEIKSQPLPGLEPPIIQPVAQRYTTELSRPTVIHEWHISAELARLLCLIAPETNSRYDDNEISIRVPVYCV
jgi:hypothetical protein